jgi:hypothetical protein
MWIFNKKQRIQPRKYDGRGSLTKKHKDLNIIPITMVQMNVYGSNDTSW